MKALIAAILLISATLFDLSCGRPSDEVQPFRSPAQAVMDSIASEDRGKFVTYHISLALEARRRTDVYFSPINEVIPREKLEEFRSISVPADFSGNLLDWTELELVPLKNLQSNYDPSNAAMDELCFPNGCVDPVDAGQLCCPF